MAAQMLQIGLKSDMANLKGVKEKLTYKRELYERLTTEHDFVVKSSGLASIGLGNGREVILISEEDKRSVVETWDKLFGKKAASIRKAKTSLSSNEYITQLLARVSQFSNACLTKKTYPNGSASKEKWLDVMIAKYLKERDVIDIGPDGMPDIRAAIPLLRFMIHGCGVCRHVVLVNSIISASLVNTGHLPKGQVRQFRSKDHAVMAYITNGTIWVLDSNYLSPFYLVPLNELPSRPKDHTNEARALRFKNAYGIDFYNEMFERLLPKQNVAAANPNANVVAPNPYGNAAAAAAAVAAPAVGAGAGAARAAISQPQVEKPAVAQPQPKPVEAAAQSATPDPDLEAQELLRILLGDIPPEIKKILDEIDDNQDDAAQSATPDQDLEAQELLRELFGDMPPEEIDDNQDKMVMVEGNGAAAFCRFEGKWDAEVRAVGNGILFHPHPNRASTPPDGFRCRLDEAGGAAAAAGVNRFIDLWNLDSPNRDGASSPSNDLDVMDNVWKVEKVIRRPK